MLIYVELGPCSPIFDPSQYAGLPLNIIALMPVLAYHFDSPTEFCLKVVTNIQKVRVCWSLCAAPAGICDRMTQQFPWKFLHSDHDEMTKLLFMPTQ